MTGRALLCILVAVGSVACALGDTASDRAPRGPRYPDLAVGIAPFATFAQPGVTLPDAADRLGARLGEHGVGRVVRGAAAEPDSGVVQDWAAAESLDAVVEGRLTQFGEAVSLDVRLRRPTDGSVVGTFTEQAETLGDVPGAIDAVTDRLLGAAVLLASLPELENGSSSAAVPPGEAETTASDAEPEEDDQPFGFRTAGGPLSINSGELEADQRPNSRKLTFTKDVVVTQGDLRVTCDRLEAHYVGEQKQPTRLLARGNVVLAQGDQKAVCDVAELDRDGSKLVCRGNARFREPGNELQGDVIEIDLENESVKALGRTRFVVHEEGATP